MERIDCGQHNRPTVGSRFRAARAAPAIGVAPGGHSSAGFPSTVEASPLTDDQVKAVVCRDNRVQVIAAAGSARTSAIVARAAYAVAKTAGLW